MIRIGVDVGGTNTDAVLLVGDKVETFAKCPTTTDVTKGVVKAITEVISKGGVKPAEIQCVMVGTTHFLNAVLQRRSLAKVAVLRLCLPAGGAIKPFADWPVDLQGCVEGHTALLPGGYEYDGRLIAELSRDTVETECEEIRRKKISSVAISGIFSPVNSQQEILVAEWIRSALPDVFVTLSHDIGQLGLLERENAAILNASLKLLAKRTISAFKSAFTSIGLSNANLYLTQNDGTLMTVDFAERYPIHTFSSGPTNSMRGAAFLSQRSNAIVIDIGGTSTDVGLLMSGFPRQSAVEAEIGGVRSNYRLPDVHSIALGGGSVVKFDDDKCTVGPLSVAYELETKSVVFGGNVMTATDMAVAGGLAEIGDRDKLRKRLAKEYHLGDDNFSKCLSTIQTRLERLIDEAKLSPTPIPVILVGGGSILVGDTLEGCSEVIRPPHYSVANAVGAAIAQVSGSEDCVISMSDTSREEAKSRVISRATERAVQLGAEPKSTQIAEYDEIPLAYLPGNAVRYRAKAVGDLLLKTIHENDQVVNQSDSTKNPENVEVELNTDEYNRVEGTPVKVAFEPNYKPNVSDGVWQLSELDIEFITIGAAILGSGGGGNPYHGKLKVLEAMKFGQIKVVRADRLNPEEMAIPCGMMGAPLVITEKIPKGDEILRAFRAVEDELGQKVAAVMGFEIGGLNSVEPMVVAALTGLPLIDADGIGRAFPEMQHFVPYILGHPVGTMALCDEHGHLSKFDHIQTGRKAEAFARAVCVVMGCSCAIALCPLKAAEILSLCTLNTVSQVWEMGRIIFAARHLKISPVEAIVKSQGGKVLIAGSISDVKREITAGFTRGFFTVSGNDEWKGKGATVEIQNENLIARLSDGEVLATVPDVISSLESESGRPVCTEELRYGLRITLVGLPAHPMLKTPEALRVVGPRGFGYQLDYQPIIGPAFNFSVFDTCLLCLAANYFCVIMIS